MSQICNITSQSYVYLNVTQVRQVTSSLLLDNLCPVISCQSDELLHTIIRYGPRASLPASGFKYEKEHSRMRKRVVMPRRDDPDWRRYRVTRRPGSPIVEWVKELRSSLIFPLIRGITYRLIVPVIFDEFSKPARTRNFSL